MHEEVYADSIGEIAVSGTVVRIDLVSLSPTEKDATGNPKPVFRQRIVMPVEGFANGAELMAKALTGLIEGGAIKRKGAPASAGHVVAPPAATAPAEPKPRSNGSPNFS